MKQYIQNIVMMFLLVAIMAPLSFAFMSYHLQLKLIKRQVKQALIEETSKDELITLSFDLRSVEFAHLRWEHDHEFEFEEKMFDIVEADTSGHLVNYLCFPDKQETALNHIFKKKLEERYAKDQSTKNRAMQMLSLFYGLYFMPLDLPESDYATLLNRVYADYSFNYSAVYLELLSPPPQFFI